MEIKGFQEMSLLDWPGKTCAVIFLNHCNFRCPYCHNAELAIGMESQNIQSYYVISRLYERKQWIDGIVISGGEPLLNRDLPEFCRTLKAHLDIGIKLDTNGSNPNLLEILLRENLVDKISMDIKAPLEDEAYTRVSRANINVSVIEESINLIIDNSNISHEFRTTVCPSLLSESEIVQIASELSCLGAQEYTLQNFNPRKTLDTSLKEVPYSYDTLNKLKSKIVDQCKIRKVNIR